MEKSKAKRKYELRVNLVKRVKGIKHFEALKIAYDLVDVVDRAWSDRRLMTQNDYCLYSILESLLDYKATKEIRRLNGFITCLLDDETGEKKEYV